MIVWEEKKVLKRILIHLGIMGRINLNSEVPTQTRIRFFNSNKRTEISAYADWLLFFENPTFVFRNRRPVFVWEFYEDLTTCILFQFGLQ